MRIRVEPYQDPIKTSAAGRADVRCVCVPAVNCAGPHWSSAAATICVPRSGLIREADLTPFNGLSAPGQFRLPRAAVRRSDIARKPDLTPLDELVGLGQ